MLIELNEALHELCYYLVFPEFINPIWQLSIMSWSEWPCPDLKCFNKQIRLLIQQKKNDAKNMEWCALISWSCLGIIDPLFVTLQQNSQIKRTRWDFRLIMIWWENCCWRNSFVFLAQSISTSTAFINVVNDAMTSSTSRQNSGLATGGPDE